MQRHLYLVRPRPKAQPLRPARVISLEARRQARLDELRSRLPHERPAA